MTPGAVIAALLTAQLLLLVPMVPGGQVDTRDFSALPRPVFRGFNAFLVSLGVVTIAVAAASAAGTPGSSAAAAVVSALYVAVFGLDLAGVFPRVADPLPVQLLVLECTDLALSGATSVLALTGAVA